MSQVVKKVLPVKAKKIENFQKEWKFYSGLKT